MFDKYLVKHEEVRGSSRSLFPLHMHQPKNSSPCLIAVLATSLQTAQIYTYKREEEEDKTFLDILIWPRIKCY